MLKYYIEHLAFLLPLLRLGFGGGGSSPAPAQTTTTTSILELSPEQKKLISLVIPKAQERIATPPTDFPGDRIAPLDPLQSLAQEQVLASVGGIQSLTDQTLAAQQFGLGPVLFPSSNPAIQDAIGAAVRPLNQQFEQTILPNIRSGANLVGQAGSSRQGIAEGIAAQGLQQQTGDISSQIAFDAFSRGLETFEKSLLLAPQTANLQTFAPQVTEAVGTQRQAFEQAQINEQVRAHAFEQQVPFATAQEVAALAFGIPGGSTTTTALGAPQATSGGGFSSFLSGASTGASIGNLVAPGVGGVIGGILGGIGSIFF